MGSLAWKYQLLIQLLFLSIPSCFTIPPSCHPNHSLALLQFKNSFAIDSSASNFTCDFSAGITSYPKTESWKEGVDCCSWDGVTCDSLTGHVTGLDLSCSWLRGPIISNSTLFLLPILRSLNLAFNNFSYSTIPLEFSHLTTLTYLNLSHSRFAGPFASAISHLSKLVSLDLSFNFLVVTSNGFRRLGQNLTVLSDLTLDWTDMSSVTIDSLLNMSSSLKHLSLEYCGLQGNLPENVLRLPNLLELNLRYNQRLGGSLPEFNRSMLLRILDLSETVISGNLPASIGNLNSLDTLNLGGCNFVGSLPASVGNLTNITSLHLSDNQFTGQIPPSLSNLESLIELDFEANNFSGNIPNVFHNLTKLASLSLRINNLSGLIPPSLFELHQLSDLSLDFNHLEGPLPNHVNGLLELDMFAISFNFLNGSIPPWLFTLPSLTHIYLSNNQLTGQLPQFHSKSLRKIELWNNKIDGPIPSSIFELVNATVIDLSSNNLNGTLDLDMFSKLQNLESLDLSNNSLSVEVNNQGNSNWPMLQMLSLSSCNVKTFPQFLSAQNQLYHLQFSHNRLNGEIPEWLWLLANSSNSLQFLDLSHNSLTSFTELSIKFNSLFHLDLSSNSIQGSISFLFNLFQLGESKSLPFFSVSSNRLTGEIPSSVCNITSLYVLDLSNNSLGGRIPDCLGSLNSLSVLNLAINNFAGPILPFNFSQDSELRSLKLNGNQFEGSFSGFLNNCKLLEVFDIGNNHIQGEFPKWLEYFPQLQVLILRSNRFHGPIGEPQSATPFPKLRIMDLANNAFTGVLPSGYFKCMIAMMNVGERRIRNYMEHGFYQDSVVVTIKNQEVVYERILTIFATMDLSHNLFGGPIPDIVGKMISLEGLNFSHNNLSGSIPPSLANMASLESLDLSSNKLDGEIPVRLTNLTFLSTLNLSDNLLTGPIPRDNQFGSFSNDSFLGNPELCGPPLSKMCGDNGNAPPPMPLTSQEEDDSLWGFGWKIVMIGYASGLVIGLSIGYMLVGVREPYWFAKMVELFRKFFVKSVRRRQIPRRQ